MNHKTLWAFALTSAAAFMVTLDNLVVTTAIPVIRRDLHASIGGLEWTVNAYTLTFAVLLLTGAALGDRFGRRRLLAIGLTLFTAASAAAALAPTATALVVARAAQGVGGAIVMPLTLTVISAAVPKEKRAQAFGIWGAVAGLAVALGPVFGERPLLAVGLSFIAFAVFWFAHAASATAEYTSLLPSLIVGGIGSGLFWAPSASVVLSTAREEEQGVASGANNSI